MGGAAITISVWLIIDLRRPTDDGIDDDDDIFADLLSDSEEEENKKDKQMKPKLKLITDSGKTQLTNNDTIDHGKISL